MVLKRLVALFLMERMHLEKVTAPIPFAGSQLGDIRHVCAFFNSDEEEYRVLLPFIKDGFQRGDKAVHIVQPNQRHEHLQRLVAEGIDMASAQKSGQFELLTNTEVYLREGLFDQDRMLEAFEKLASGNAKGGFPLSRICCRMDWAAEGKSYVPDLIEFESRVNHVWKRHKDTVICTYHLEKFGGDTVIDIMRTHPMIIIGGILQRNPFFVPPGEFLREFHERRTGRSTKASTGS
jgi:MEDS: MEthanogen/methylotroph, DcmR Sensory domain